MAPLTRRQLHTFEDQLEQLVPKLEAYTYYQLLGVDPQASAAVIEFTYNQRVAEYLEVRGNKRCTASLFQNLGKLLERLEEARRILTDTTLRNEYHQWLAAGHTRHWGANVKPREVEQRDEYIEKAAAALERKLGGQMVQAPEEEGDAGKHWTIDLGEGEAAEELAQSGDVDAMDRHLRADLERLGVRDDEGEDEDESASLDRALLDRTEDGLRAELDEMGVKDEEGEAEDESASLNPSFIAEAEQWLRAELKTMGVEDEDVAADESVSLDPAYIERALAHLEQQLNADGVRRDEVGEEEGRPASLDLEHIAQVVATLERQVSQDRKAASQEPHQRRGRELLQQMRKRLAPIKAPRVGQRGDEMVIDLDDE
ncbi:MAG: hypothetical protein CSB49_01530 [Proteobacteria bacterium]|nr:MAG: hypothetical protein CSB49_01530 [Pseudomonadota bacterium]